MDSEIDRLVRLAALKSVAPNFTKSAPREKREPKPQRKLVDPTRVLTPSRRTPLYGRTILRQAVNPSARPDGRPALGLRHSAITVSDMVAVDSGVTPGADRCACVPSLVDVAAAAAAEATQRAGYRVGMRVRVRNRGRDGSTRERRYRTVICNGASASAENGITVRRSVAPDSAIVGILMADCEVTVHPPGPVRWTKASQLPKEQIAQYRQAFALFDNDGDGGITSAELGTVLRSLGQDPSEGELQQMVDAVDVDNNGEIDFEEFINMMISSNTVEDVEQEKGGEVGGGGVQLAGQDLSQQLRVRMTQCANNSRQQGLADAASASGLSGWVDAANLSPVATVGGFGGAGGGWSSTGALGGVSTYNHEGVVVGVVTPVNGTGVAHQHHHGSAVGGLWVQLGRAAGDRIRLLQRKISRREQALFTAGHEDSPEGEEQRPEPPLPKMGSSPDRLLAKGDPLVSKLRSELEILLSRRSQHQWCQFEDVLPLQEPEPPRIIATTGGSVTPRRSKQALATGFTQQASLVPSMLASASLVGVASEVSSSQWSQNLGASSAHWASADALINATPTNSWNGCISNGAAAENGGTTFATQPSFTRIRQQLPWADRGALLPSGSRTMRSSSSFTLTVAAEIARRSLQARTPREVMSQARQGMPGQTKPTAPLRHTARRKVTDATSKTSGRQVDGVDCWASVSTMPSSVGTSHSAAKMIAPVLPSRVIWRANTYDSARLRDNSDGPRRTILGDGPRVVSALLPQPPTKASHDQRVLSAVGASRRSGGIFGGLFEQLSAPRPVTSGTQSGRAAPSGGNPGWGERSQRAANFHRGRVDHRMAMVHAAPLPPMASTKQHTVARHFVHHHRHPPG